MAALDQYEASRSAATTREWVDVETDDSESLKAEVYIGGNDSLCPTTDHQASGISPSLLLGAKEQGLPA